VQYLQYLVIVGAIVNLLGIVSYMKETLRGNTRPNRVTWFLWAVAPLIATAASLSGGAGWAVLPVFMAGFGPLLILFASFVNKKSYWKLGKFDYLCGVFSLFALVFWKITNDPVVAIIFSILSDGFAGIPTFIKSWKYPETETVDAYATGLFSSLTSFAAVKVINFSSITFPIYLVIANSLLILAIYRKKLFRN
jgi:hypothetical protein